MVKYCKECAYSGLNIHGDLICTNPEVNKNDAWVLGSTTGAGKRCTEERRDSGWFQVCGIKGKQFKALLIID